MARWASAGCRHSISKQALTSDHTSLPRPREVIEQAIRHSVLDLRQRHPPRSARSQRRYRAHARGQSRSLSGWATKADGNDLPSSQRQSLDDGLCRRGAGTPVDRALAIAESTDDGLLRHQARSHLSSAPPRPWRLSAGGRDVPRIPERLGGGRALRQCFSVVTPLVVTSTAYLTWSLAELGEFAEAARRAEESLRRPKRSRTRSL
jgi:hypothetical protein